MLVKRKGEMIVVGNKPIIGSKFNGKPQEFIDTQNEIRWSVLATLSDDAIKVQNALFSSPIKVKITQYRDQSKAMDKIFKQFLNTKKV